MKQFLRCICCILLFILFLAMIFGIDYVSSRFFNSKPFLAIKSTSENEYVYKSVLYKVFYCKDENGVLKRHFEPRNSRFSCPMHPVKEKKFTIEETNAESYPQAIEVFYENPEYICEYNVIKSSLVNVRFEDGKVLNIKDVLELKLVSISSLIEAGIPCRRKMNEIN